MEQVKRLTLKQWLMLGVLSVLGLGGGNALLGGQNLQISQSAASTSTLVYQVAGAASTTLMASTGDADIIDFNLFVGTASSSPEIIWTYEFSMDGNAWYSEKGNTLTSSQLRTHGVQPLVNSWSPNTASSTGNFTVEPVAAKYLKVSLGTVGGDADVHLQVVKRNQNN